MSIFQLFSKSSSKRIYLDHAATTPIDSRILSVMARISMKSYANPGSLHTDSHDALSVLETARSRMKAQLNAFNHDIIFTRGGTEACNIGVRHALAMFSGVHLGVTPHVIISPLEHSAVYELCSYLAKTGQIELSFAPTNDCGVVEPSQLMGLVRPETALVAVQMVNSELGVVQPIKKLSHLLRRYRSQCGGTRFPQLLTDAIQAGDTMDIHVQSLGVDYLTLSASKFYGPKSGGVLCIPHAARTVAGVLFGGDQEFGVRPGTEDVSIVAGTVSGYGISIDSRQNSTKHFRKLRDYFYSMILLNVPECLITVEPELCAPHICHIAVPRIDSEYAVLFFDKHGISVASQSACSAHDGGVSRVVSYIWKQKGLGSPDSYAHLRFSLGRTTQKADIDKVFSVLSQLVQQVYVRS